MRNVTVTRSETEWGELPFLTRETIQMRLENSERRAAEETRRAIAAFRLRHVPTIGPNGGWRGLAKQFARMARIARFYAALYRKFLAGGRWCRGDKVECNGNREAVVGDYYGDGMYIVRLWQGFRHVGDVCVGASELRAR